jgi:hypothetical protein
VELSTAREATFSLKKNVVNFVLDGIQIFDIIHTDRLHISYNWPIIHFVQFKATDLYQ